MDCISLSSAVSATPGTDMATASATPGCNADAQRFEEALKRPEGNDLYVDANHLALPGNPLVGLMHSFESLKLSPETGHHAGRTEHSEPSHDHDASHETGDEQRAQQDHFSEFGDMLLGVQSQILRTTLMVETMNTAKQGVTTLFQQQG